jgi:DNA-binding transcriptional MerR regulator
MRLYGARDIVCLKLVKRLLDTGISLAAIRTAVETLRTWPTESWSDLILLSNGSEVFMTTSNEEVLDLVARGEGLFGIAVSKLTAEVRATLEGFSQVEPR